MNISILGKYPVIHEGIKSILKNKYENITSFTSIEDYLKTLNSKKNQNLINTEDTILIILLFDSNLKIINNILKIKCKYPNKIKLLTIDFNENKYIFSKAPKLNIDGYLSGTFTQEDIIYALYKISTGTKFYDQLIKDETAVTYTNKNLDSHLTRRELEILNQLSNGLSNFDIAKNLTISENTVKKHISNIFVKINVKDRTQATIYAYESGLIAKPLFL